MKVYIIGAGAGDPELITVKGKKAIEDSEIIIYAGSLVNQEILKYNQSAEVYNSARLDLDEIIAIIKEAKENNKNVARVHTGDPSIYGAIKEQIELFKENEIDYEIIPGVSSFLAAAAALEVEYTLPDISQTVILTRQAGRTPVPEKEELSKLASARASMAIFLSVQMIEEVQQELLKEYDQETPVAVVAKVSWPEEKIIRTTLIDLPEKTIEANIKKTALILVGDFLASQGEKSKLYDKNYSHQYRKADKKKKAILVVSFGTSYHQTRKKTIEACEKRIASEFKDYDIKRAFTSQMIINKLKKRDNISINNPKEALKELYKEGYEEVIVQPLHIINGSEFHEIAREVNRFKNQFKEIKLGNALLTDQSDYLKLVETLSSALNTREKEVVFMGHGSKHPANATYPALDYTFKAEGYSNFHIGAVEGYPGIDQVISNLSQAKSKNIVLTPLMLVAGDHAINDMAGEGRDSWQNLLESEGFNVENILKGLGEYQGVQQMYLNKINNLIKN